MSTLDFSTPSYPPTERHIGVQMLIFGSKKYLDMDISAHTYLFKRKLAMIPQWLSNKNGQINHIYFCYISLVLFLALRLANTSEMEK